MTKNERREKREGERERDEGERRGREWERKRERNYQLVPTAITYTVHVIKYCAPLTGLTHGLWVLGLAQNLQQVIVGQEVEPWEELPLGLQIHVQ